MSSVQFSTEQLAALETDKHLIVLANAGAGKTSVLTKRFQQLMATVHNAESSIVAITFTNKAAAEMRQRIGASANARIGTFHSFCLNLLQKYSKATENTSILDEESDLIQRLLQAAIATAVEYYTSIPDLHTKLIFLYQELKADTFTSCVMSYLFEFATTLQIEPSLDYATERYLELKQLVCRQLCLQLLTELHVAFLRAGAFAVDSGIGQQTNELLNCFQSEPESTTKYIEVTLQLFDKYYTSTGKPRAASKFNSDKLHAACPNVSATQLNTLLRLQKSAEDTTYAFSVYSTLRDFAVCAANFYTSAKRERGIVTFDDILVTTYSLLKNSPDIARLEGEKIAYLMVDEVQDTDPVQFDIISLLVPQLVGQRPFPGATTKVFLVGDNKQSIYAFRGADVRQFSHMEEAIATANKVDGIADSGKRTLSASYRMMPELVDRINDICTTMFSLPDVDTVHSEFEVQYQELIAGRTPSDYAHSGTFQHFSFDKQEKDDALHEMEHTSNIIAHILGNPSEYMVSQGNTLRFPRAKDICVLVKRATYSPELQEALRAKNIPSFLYSIQNFHTLPEVADCSDLALWLLNSTDSLKLASILRSPLFYCSLTDLTQCAALAENGSWYTPLCEARYNIQMSAELQNAIDILRESEAYYKHHTLVQTIRFILKRTSYYERRCTESDMFTVLETVEDILDIIRDAESIPLQSGHDIAHSIVQKISGKHKPTPNSNLDAVQVMTIHSAKGLEFPIVIIADVSSRNNSDTIAYTSELGITPSLPTSYWQNNFSGLEVTRLPSFVYDVNNHLAKRSHLAEQRRLAYVALTRAIDHLIVLTSFNPSGSLGKVLHRSIAQQPWFTERNVTLFNPAQPLQKSADVIDIIDLTQPILVGVSPRTSISATKILNTHSQEATPLQPSQSNTAGVLYGTVFHECLDVLFSAHQSELSTITTIVLADIVTPIIQRHNELDTNEMIQELFFTISSVLPLLPKDASLHTEVPIVSSHNSTEYNGTLDLVCLKGNEAIIFDWKTNRIQSEENFESLSKHYQLQMQFYARILLSSNNINSVHTNLVFSNALVLALPRAIVSNSYYRSDIAWLAANADDQAH